MLKTNLDPVRECLDVLTKAFGPVSLDLLAEFDPESCSPSTFRIHSSRYLSPSGRWPYSGAWDRRAVYTLRKPMPHPHVTSLWPTAGAHDYKGSARLGQRRGQLDEAAEQIFPRLHEIPRQSRRLRLNPRFVEWLMGIPIGWTEL